MAAKLWYRYTDEGGECWRMQTTAALAHHQVLRRKADFLLGEDFFGWTPDRPRSGDMDEYHCQ